MAHSAEIGIFGGSGLYSLLDKYEEIKIETPYGAPSDLLAVGEMAGRKVAFLPRHGRKHSIPPHMINYRANVYAFKQLGCHTIIGPCSAGSLQRSIKPGDFVVCDQFIDRTKGRIDTYYDGPQATHVSAAEPYSQALRPLACAACREAGVTVHDGGTVVIIQGPRFSSRAESQWFTKMGWQVVNMTQYPEAYLARELELHYVNLTLVTDYDCGLEGDTGAVTATDVLQVFHQNIENVKKVIRLLVPQIPADEAYLEQVRVLKFSRFL